MGSTDSKRRSARCSKPGGLDRTQYGLPGKLFRHLRSGPERRHRDPGFHGMGPDNPRAQDALSLRAHPR